MIETKSRIAGLLLGLTVLWSGVALGNPLAPIAARYRIHQTVPLYYYPGMAQAPQVLAQLPPETVIQVPNLDFNLPEFSNPWIMSSPGLTPAYITWLNSTMRSDSPGNTFLNPITLTQSAELIDTDEDEARYVSDRDESENETEEDAAVTQPGVRHTEKSEQPKKATQTKRKKPSKSTSEDNVTLAVVDVLGPQLAAGGVPQGRPCNCDDSKITSGVSPARKHPILKKVRPHEGVDISVPMNTPVIATASGRVSATGREGGLGIGLHIDHGGDKETVYGHNSKIAINPLTELPWREGDWVRAGQVIAYSGKTGLATGPHIHYEYRVGGIPQVAPFPYAVAASGSQRGKIKRNRGKRTVTAKAKTSVAGDRYASRKTSASTAMD